MIAFRYNQQVSPPAPFVHVSGCAPDHARVIDLLPALVDSAADRTLIPAQLVHDLGLQPLREIQVEVAGGQIITLPAYLMDLAIRERGYVRIEAVASQGETYLLLGRDVLNHHRVVLDGPRQAIEIE